MTTTEVTGYIIAAATFVGTVVFPYIAKRNSRNETNSANEIVGFKTIIDELKVDRDDSRKELKVNRSEADAHIKALEAEWLAKLAVSNARIKELENQVGELKQTLFDIQNPRK